METATDGQTGQGRSQPAVLREAHLGVRLTAPFMEELRDTAVRRGMNVSSFVEYTLRREVEKERRKREAKEKKAS